MENNIYNAPDSNLTHDVDVEDELASRWNRLAASIIDGLTIMPFTLTLMYFTGGFDGITSGKQPSILYTFGIALVGVLVFVIIHGKLLISSGQTLGKKLLEIRIVKMDGGPVDMPALLKRYGFYWFFPQIPIAGPFINLVNILFIFSQSKRCVHDLVGGTKVIKALAGSPAR